MNPSLHETVGRFKGMRTRELEFQWPFAREFHRMPVQWTDGECVCHGLWRLPANWMMEFETLRPTQTQELGQEIRFVKESRVKYHCTNFVPGLPLDPTNYLAIENYRRKSNTRTELSRMDGPT